MKDKVFNKKQGIIVIAMMIIIIILLTIAAIMVSNDNKNKTVNNRTIMIYMCGADLESRLGIATADLNSIIPSSIDLNTTNVIVYLGGTTKWHNSFASSNSNNIVKLTENGYEIVKQEERKNLGDADTFAGFLNFAYENYKADRYDLIIYDHGMGALGSISDDFSDDFLYAFEMQDALEKTHFNKNNKMETVLFRTCLNGTYEIANVFSPYANYMVASEEITRGSKDSNVFNFINDLNLNDDGNVFGSKFISGYKQYMDSLDYFGDLDSTYSVLDLRKFSNLSNSLDSFFSDVDVKKDFNKISKIRANMHQYAVEAADSSDYDTVDLYELINSMKELSPSKANKVLKSFDEVVKENWAINNHSFGLSIYFPYNGSSSVIELHMKVFDRLNINNNYLKFIKGFASIKGDKSGISMNFSNNALSMKNKEFSIDLSSDQVKDFARARYIIYEKNDDGTYGLVVRSNAELENNKLKAKLYNNIINISDGTNKTYIPVSEITSNGDYKEYITYVVLSRRKDTLEVVNGNLHLKVKDNKVYESEIIESEKGKEGGILLDPKDYDTLMFEHTKWNVLDANGNYSGPKRTDSMSVWEYKTNNGYELSLSSLDDKDNYYCVFQIYDVKGNVYYSNLEKIK